MSSDQQPKKGISRRNFFKGSLGAATGVALSGAILTGCSSAGAAGQPAPTQASEADPIPPVNPPSSWDYTADVVVVGTGGGGLAAANLAAENGKSVIAIEKNGTVGGATRHAMAFVVMPGGSKQQNEIKYAWPEWPFNPNTTIGKLNDVFQYSFDEKLMRSLISVGGECADWMQTHEGINWFFIPNGVGWIDMDIIQGKQNAVLGMNNTVNAMEANAKKAGAKIMTLTKCETLVVDNGRVVGIQVTDTATGAKKYIKANKGVILCAGGIGMNQELLKKYIPSAYAGATQGGPFPFHTGEAFRMGLGAGADYSGFDSWCCWEGALDDYFGDGDKEYWHYFWHGERQLVQNAWLLINKRGDRLPFYSTDESQPNFNPLVPAGQMGDLSNCAAWMSTLGRRAYCIFDSDYPTNVFKICGNHPDVSRKPLTPDDHILKNSLVSDDWQAEVQQAIDRGAIKKADTIEELADKLHLEKARVVAAVNRWNELCAKGVDTDLAVPYVKKWLIPITKGPFYGAAMSGQIGKTMCGLRVDENLQVMKPDGHVIPGLYANYTTAGGQCGESSYGGLMNPGIYAGNGMSWISGYLACKSLLAAKE